MNNSTRENPLKRFSVPKAVYDVALIAFLLPSLLYLHAYVYKLGKFDFYNIPSDYIEVGYNDILALWSVSLIFLLILLLPLYTLFLPQKVMEGIFKKNSKKPENNEKSSKTFLVVFRVLITSMMIIVSLVMLANMEAYVEFFASVYILLFAILFTILMFGIHLVWNTEHGVYQKFIKIGSFIFAVLILLSSTGGIARKMGEFHAKKKTDYETVCSPEKNWIRIAKSGDQIIAKEIDPVSKKANKKTLVIGSNCEDVISFENISLPPAE